MAKYRVGSRMNEITEFQEARFIGATEMLAGEFLD